MMNHFLAILLAYIIDFIVGDPKQWPHPVKWFGKFIHYFDGKLNKGSYRKQKGILMVVLIICTVFVLSMVITFVSYQLHPVFGIIVEATLIATTIAQTSLREAALEVVEPLKKQDIHEARNKLSYIVGRDTEHLSERELIRGTVETVAENTSDGITAPLFWSFLGGAPLALVYRAVNTCDSMVGYRNDKYENFGWASAKLDDILNWIPARLTGLIMMIVMRPQESSLRAALSILFRDASKHHSPNSGWGEAAIAAILGVQLGGTNTYQGKKSQSPLIGEPSTNLQVKHILKTITIMHRTVFLFLVFMLIGGMIIELATTWI
ncbi:adenosylcobinamide-phosphate synthase CbiB [Virgibacillus soli]